MLLADFNAQTRQIATEALEAAGQAARSQRVDVSDRASVHAIAQAAADLGDVVQIVNTAGLSPVQASAQAVLAAVGRRFESDPHSALISTPLADRVRPEPTCTLNNRPPSDTPAGATPA